MEVHSAPGPPRSNIVVVAGRRVATLEVERHRDRGHIELADGTRWPIDRPPGAGEWWITGPRDEHDGTLRRRTLLRERFELRLTRLQVEVVPVGSPWRRRWDVLDPEQRVVIEVRQRLLSRPLHDVTVRSGDLPAELPLVVAWTLALAVSPPIAETRRPRWTAR